MAVLPDADRFATWADLMADMSRDRDPVAITKADLRAAVDAIDGFLNTNATAINNALPTAAKNGLTTAQKARLLNAVIRRRYITGA